MAFLWLVSSFILIVEIIFTIIQPIYTTMCLILKWVISDEKYKPKYKDFVQWSVYWIAFAVLNLFDPGQLYIPKDFFIMLHFCKVFILTLLAHPKLYGAFWLYNEVYEDPLLKQQIGQYKAKVVEVTFNWINGMYRKYKERIEKFNVKMIEHMKAKGDEKIESVSSADIPNAELKRTENTTEVATAEDIENKRKEEEQLFLI